VVLEGVERGALELGEVRGPLCDLLTSTRRLLPIIVIEHELAGVAS